MCYKVLSGWTRQQAPNEASACLQTLCMMRHTRVIRVGPLEPRSESQALRWLEQILVRHLNVVLPGNSRLRKQCSACSCVLQYMRCARY